MRRQHPDIVADGDTFRLDGESRSRQTPALCQNVVEQHGIDTADDKIRVGMNVIVVGDRVNAKVALGAQQNVIRDGAAPSVATRRPRRSASLRKRLTSASRTLITSRNL